MSCIRVCALMCLHTLEVLLRTGATSCCCALAPVRSSSSTAFLFAGLASNCGGAAPCQVHSTEVIDLKDALQKQQGLVLLVAAGGSDGGPAIAHTSDELCKVLGMPSNKSGQTACKVLTDTSREVLLKTSEDVISGKPDVRSVVLTLCCEDGTMLCARASGQPVADGSLAMTHVLYTLELVDVAMLSAAIATLDSTGSADLIASTKVPFSIKHASLAWCRLYGLTSAEVTGRSMHIVHGPLTDQRAFKRMISDAMAGQCGRDMLTCYRKDGTAVTALVTICPLMASDGAVDHVRVLVDQSPAHTKPEAVTQTAGEIADGSRRLNCTVSGTACDAVAMSHAPSSAPEHAPSRVKLPDASGGRITHLNGRAQLVLYQTADPTLEHCLVYLDILRDVSIVNKWEWEGDVLKVDFDARQVLARTQKSAWCRMWTADLRTWHAWWNRMLWIISEAPRNTLQPYHKPPVAIAVAGGEVVPPYAGACSGPTLSALMGVDDEMRLSGMTNSVCLVDTQLRVVFANSAFQRMMRYSSRQLLGAPLFELCAKNANVEEVNRVKLCLQSCALNRRQLSSCLLLCKGDGSTIWASILGEPVPLTELDRSSASQHRGTGAPAQEPDAWRTCMLMSIEDSTDIIAPSSPLPLGPVEEAPDESELPEETDPYVVQMAQELAVMQDQTVAEWKHALASMHASQFAPATPLTEEGGASSPDDAASSAQCREILVQIPEEMTRLGFVEALWQLKAQGQVKAWRWECDFLSLTIVRDALREHACLEAARLPKLGGSRLGCKCLDDADSLGAGTWQQRITSLVRWTLRQGWALGSELAEPGTDFDFLTVADEAGARVAAACPADTALMRHAQQEQKRQAQAAAQHSALHAGAAPHVSQMLAAERRKVERLEHLLERETAAKLNANARALAASAQNTLLSRQVKRLQETLEAQSTTLEAKTQALQSLFSQQEIDRSVSAVALKAMESTLHRKTCEIETLLARVAQLSDETQTLKGMLDMGASSSDTQGSSSRGVCVLAHAC